MKLEDLFTVKNGTPSSEVVVLPASGFGRIPYIRPASTQQRTVAGWVNTASVKPSSIYSKGELFVSTDGEGSHSYAYVSDFEFVPNSNVSVLIPKKKMLLQEKLYYAKCITMNRYKFSYGRKPKGDRLKSIVLPSNAPMWVSSTNIQKLDISIEHTHSKQLDIANWKAFEFQELFEIARGVGPRRCDLDGTGTTPFVTSSDSNNGRTGFTSMKPLHLGNTIGVNRNGSVAEAFYQKIPFCSTEDVHIFTPKFEMDAYIALFLTTLIRREKYRFGYGRKWGIQRMKISTIRLPITQTKEPDWEYMRAYIKALPYSSQI